MFDASPLTHFARAGELATLHALVADFECVTTRAVRGELNNGVSVHPEIEDALRIGWLKEVRCDELQELYLFGEYMNRFGNFERNAGEASVLAWAERHGAAAYVDDEVACRVGRSRGVVVHRTLQLVVAALRTGKLDETRAQDLVRSLADNDARFPKAAREDLFGWARSLSPPLL